MHLTALNQIMKQIKITILAIILTSLSGCYDNVISSIPDYPVHLQLNLTTTYPTFKNSINQYLLFEKRIFETDAIGFGGIIVYTGFDGAYYAFDMACPHEAKREIKVYPNDLGQAVCKECGTVYDMSYGIGNPTSGPAEETLKRYRTSLSGDVLYVLR